MSTTIRIITLAVLVILGVLLFGYWRSPAPVSIVVQEVERGRVEATVANTRAGTVMACRRARLSLPSGGQIASLPIHEGDQVEANSILLELWNEDLKAELQLTGEQVLAAQAQANESCLRAEVAARDAERLQRLRKQNAVSEEQADQAQGDANARAAACQAARVAIAVARSRVVIQKAALERTRLRAPFPGIIAEINGELGEFVTPSPIGIATPPAVDLIDGCCVYISAPIDEVDGPKIHADMEARIHLDAFPDNDFPGRVRRVAPYVMDYEKQARTVDIEVDFVVPNDGPTLLPGYSADVEVILAVRDQVLRVPTQALLEGNRVWIYNPVSRKIEERHIKTGIGNWQQTEVIEGLQEGDQVVLSVDREGVAPGVPASPETAQP